MNYTVRMTIDYASDQTLRFDLESQAVDTAKALKRSRVFAQIEVENRHSQVIWATYPISLAIAAESAAKRAR